MKNQKRALSLFLCISLLLGCLAVSGFSATAEEITWADATVGQWATLTADSTILGETNFLKGVIPTDGAGNARTIDGDLAVATDGKVASKGDSSSVMTVKVGRGSWYNVVYDMGKICTVQDFAAAAGEGDKRYAPHMLKIYVGNSNKTADLCTEANLAVHVDKVDINGYQWQFKAEKAFVGRYVCFSVYAPPWLGGGHSVTQESNPECYDANGTRVFDEWYQLFRIGEIGAYGVEGSKLDKGYFKTLTADSEILKETNLLAGKTPTNGTSTSTYKLGRGSWDVATDGTLSVKANYEAASLSVTSVWGNNWKKFTFATNKTYYFNRFVFGGSDEGAAYTPHSIKIYVGNDLSTLYTDANLVVDADRFDVTGQHWEFVPEKVAAGCYVGYDIYIPEYYAGTDTEETKPLCYKDGTAIYAMWHGQLRIGEMGAYGSEWGDLTVGDWAGLTATDDLLKETNLLAGKTPTNGTGTSTYKLGRGSWDIATDGALSVKANYEAASLSVSSVWGNNWKKFTFATDGLYQFDHFVFGGSDEGANYTPHSIKIYVSNTLDDLYSDANLVVDADRFDVTGQHWKFKPGKAAVGCYVGYDIYIPEYYAGTDTEETKPLCYKDGTAIYAMWHGQLRIGEMGAYGEAVAAPVANLGGQIRNPEATNNYALRFGFSMDMTGVTYADADPKASGNYARAIAEDAKVTIDGNAYGVADFGVLVSSVVSEDMTIADVDDSMTKKVRAVNLYDVADEAITFTAVVTGIPAAHKDTLLYARPYVELTDGTVLYGEMISRSVNIVTDSMA